MVSGKTDRSFDRKLEQLVLQRLRAGETPASLLTQLQARLDPDEADALLERAEARLTQSQKPDPQTTLSARVLMGIVYLWALVLLFQNIGVILSVRDLGAAEGDLGPVMTRLVALASLRIGLLTAAVLVHVRWRTLYSAAFLGLIVLYAFPFGLYLDSWLVRYRTPPPLAGLISVSSLCSYAAVGLIAVATAQRRRASPPLADPLVFD
jgi:hypothetical protein